MICQPCRDRDHLACLSTSCTGAHRGSNVRALTDDERQLVRKGLRADCPAFRDATDAPQEASGATGAPSGTPDDRAARRGAQGRAQRNGRTR